MLSPAESTGCDVSNGNRRENVGFLLRASRGQSTVEFAVVLAASLSLAMALGAAWHLFGQADPVTHALASATHHLKSVAPGAMADVFMY